MSAHTRSRSLELEIGLFVRSAAVSSIYCVSEHLAILAQAVRLCDKYLVHMGWLKCSLLIREDQWMTNW